MEKEVPTRLESQKSKPEGVKSLGMSFNDWKKQKDAKNKEKPQPKRNLVRPSLGGIKPFFIVATRNNWQPLPSFTPHPPIPLRLQFPPEQIRDYSKPNNTFQKPSQGRNNYRKQPNPPLQFQMISQERNSTTKQPNSPLQSERITPRNFPASSVASTSRPEQTKTRNTNTKPPSQQRQVPKNTTTEFRPRSNINKSDEKSQERIGEWIIKPQMPLTMVTITPESREEKKRLWREYREAMKPFKNRELANAKRVIQRLGKCNINELDEINRGRLERAQEQIATHKKIQCEKAAQYMRMQEVQTDKGPKLIPMQCAGNQGSMEQSKVQIYMKKPKLLRNNNNPGRGRGGVHSGPMNRNPPFSGPNRQNTHFTSAYNNFVSGGFNFG